MPSLKDLHAYQTYAIERIVELPYVGLFLDLGLGKTVSTLTAVDRLLFDLMDSDRVLVIAPKRVAESTWSKEVNKWDHLQHLRIAKVLGDEKTRKEALRQKADIYIINRENVPWLVAQYGMAWPFDTVIIDELSSFKSAKASRFKALRRVRPLMRRVIGLTGTPQPNGLEDLWSQIYLLDQGQRLGQTIGGYRERYLKPKSMMGHIVTKYKARDGAADAVQAAIADICISMRKEDYLDLPPLINETIDVGLSSDLLEKYRQFERDAIISIIDGEDINAVNAAALTNKLLQFTNGAVYNDDKVYRVVHDEKLDALEELIEAANGKPVLVFYAYKHDQERIRKRLHAYRVREMKGEADLDAWNSGEVEVMLAHPASAGHGLNMQDGGNTIVWFSLPWSLELYQQAVARLHRQGQTQTVVNYRLAVPGTVEDDVMAALNSKAEGQDALLDALKARIQNVLNQYNGTDHFQHRNVPRRA